MWIPSQSAQARKPLCRPNGPSQPMLVTPGQPADHGDVAAVAVAERFDGPARGSGAGSPPPRTCPPGWRPGPRPGVGRPAFHGCTAASPTTKISGWPGIVRSGPTITRPARSVSAPVADATVRANDEALHAGRPQDGPRRDLGRGAVGRRRRGRTARRCPRPASSSAPRPRAARAAAARSASDPADTAAGSDPAPRPAGSSPRRAGSPGSRA